MKHLQAVKSVVGLLLLSAVAHGQLMQQVKPACSLVVIEAKPGSTAFPIEPADLDYKHLVLDGGKEVVVFTTGHHKRIVLFVFTNGERRPDVQRHIIKVEGGPKPPDPDNPDPDPNPKPLSELAEWVRDEGRKAGFPLVMAKLIAANYEQVAKIIEARESDPQNMPSVGEFDKQVKALNAQTMKTDPLPRSVEPMYNTLMSHLEKVKNQNQQKKAFRSIAQGLRAIEEARGK